MTAEQHHDLLDLIRAVKGKVMLSGYRNQLYDELLADWNRHDVSVANNMAGGARKSRRIESLWLNY
jgi:DNA adenine methylase